MNPEPSLFELYSNNPEYGWLFKATISLQTELDKVPNYS